MLRSYISYHPAAGSTTSAYNALVDMRKSRVTNKSSLPSGAGSLQITSWGRVSISRPRTAFWVPSRCLRKYSWPLPLDPNRFERHKNRMRGMFAMESGSWMAKFSSPRFSLPTTREMTS